MEGPNSHNTLSHLSIARVSGYDPANHAVYVTLPSMQQLSESAKVLINGPADATRIEQTPLPVIGTWGLIAFPFGDVRSIIWIGSFYQSLVNAVNSDNTPESGQMRYMSHASGAYSVLDYDGNYYYYSPDGTQLILNAGGDAPVTRRHNVDEHINQNEIVIGNSFRNPQPPSPFTASIVHPSGAAITIQSNGDIVIQQANGTTTTTLDQSGNIDIEGGPGSLVGVHATNVQVQALANVQIQAVQQIELATPGASILITPDIVEISPSLITYSIATLQSIS